MTYGVIETWQQRVRVHASKKCTTLLSTPVLPIPTIIDATFDMSRETSNINSRCRCFVTPALVGHERRSTDHSHDLIAKASIQHQHADCLSHKNWKAAERFVMDAIRLPCQQSMSGLTVSSCRQGIIRSICKWETGGDNEMIWHRWSEPSEEWKVIHHIRRRRIYMSTHQVQEAKSWRALVSLVL